MPKRSFLRLSTSLLALLLISGCGDNANSNLPEAASNLVDPSKKDAASTLPHTVDSATEFVAAVESLAPEVEEPVLRETVTEEIEVVRVEKTSEASKPNIQIKQELKAPENKAIEQDWSGIILIPDRTRMSKAYSTEVKLERIEAHPLTNEKLRVWVRVANTSSLPLDTRIACNFSDSNQATNKTDFVPVTIPAKGSVDAYFMSPMSDVRSYTILVR